MNRLQRLHAAGQSIWLDFLDRNLLLSGKLVQRIEEDALTGMTSNPTIFEKAFAEGSEYDADLAAAPEGATSWQLFETIAASDVRTACDMFRPVYDRTEGVDGFVSFEVSPGSANDAAETVAEARRLWALVDRPNVMIKVPGTEAGAIATRRLTGEGINVNITLLFAVEAHARVIDAYIAGLEDRVASGKPIDRIASVASFFVSRVDGEIDKRLDAMIAAEGDAAVKERLASLKGRAAIANAKMAYRLFQEQFGGERWQRVAAQGGRVQRPLWASTSTKNKAYRDVLYVEELIGPDTVNTMPPQTIEAFRDHGETRRSVDEDVEAGAQLLRDLEAVGIPMHGVTAQLLGEGLANFSKSFDTLIAGLEAKSRELGRALTAH